MSKRPLIVSPCLLDWTSAVTVVDIGDIWNWFEHGTYENVARVDVVLLVVKLVNVAFVWTWKSGSGVSGRDKVVGVFMDDK